MFCDNFLQIRKIILVNIEEYARILTVIERKKKFYICVFSEKLVD